ARGGLAIMSFNIILAGSRGKMGSEAVKMINKEPTFSLVACIDHKNGPSTTQEVQELAGKALPVYTDAGRCFQEEESDIFIDLTNPEAGYINTKSALTHGLRSVVGTSGFSNEEINELSNIAVEKATGCIIAPNFALGAVLMMQFSKMAAKYFPDVEII